MNRLKRGSASLLLMAACTGFPFFGKQSPGRGTIKDTGSTDVRVPPRTVMEIQDIQYDGWTLSGRVLVSPETGPLRLDRRLISWFDVEIKRVSDCRYGSVKSIHADVFPPLARSENLLVLEPGYWYGHTVRFGLFDEHFTGLGPECVEADIILLSFDGGRIARQRIRAVRPPQQDMDGGTPLDGGPQEEPQPSPDAGSP
ncbi:hypothetical protein [Archangium sp.]|uniref:hypothetical protein n=1 Tax=Archangium sp. TaxID=1872627 RepID=UPI002D625423|nr:hypothetical protein [Archangium sp.]HYO53681.1 hypothetical protein [Archangium sp.]